tara:strand:+ start:501 stop:1118 length:618 start_codon:yes stop_codon:yes gene_type:complete
MIGASNFIWGFRMSLNLKNLTLGIAVLSLSACSSAFEPTVKSTDIESDSVLSSLPSLSQTTITKAEAALRTCLGRGSDATFSQSDSSDISISLVSTGTSSNSDSGGNAESSGETEMSGRTPGVLIAREMFFRTCEFSNNYQLSKQEALKLYLQTLSAVSEGWKAEIQKTTITLGETVGVNDTNTTSDANNGDTGVSTGSTSSPSN